MAFVLTQCTVLRTTSSKGCENKFITDIYWPMYEQCLETYITI